MLFRGFEFYVDYKNIFVTTNLLLINKNCITLCSRPIIAAEATLARELKCADSLACLRLLCGWEKEEIVKKRRDRGKDEKRKRKARGAKAGE